MNANVVEQRFSNKIDDKRKPWLSALFPAVSHNNTNLGRHHNTCFGAISIKVSIRIIKIHPQYTLSPFLSSPGLGCREQPC
jgi:hypothetical protein